MPGLFRGIVAVCTLLVVTSPAWAQEHWSNDDIPTISVSGTAELEAAPDFIQWQVHIVDEDAAPAVAKARNDERYEALLEIADDLDIEPSDIMAGTLSVNRTYHIDERGRRGEFKGYRVRRSAVLILRDFDGFDELLQQLAEQGFEFSIEYSSTQVHTMKREARAEAVRIARDKAREMAEVLGQELGRPLQVQEVSSRVAGFDLDDALSNSNVVRVDEGGGDLTAVGLRQGAISVTASVSVVFELVQPE